MIPDRRISVNIIRAFEGPRHAKAEAIWERYAHEHRHQMVLHVFDNLDAKLCHSDCLKVIWSQERWRTNNQTIFTEFDFLPAPSFVQWPKGFTLEHPIQAAEYVTRDPVTHALLPHGIPGAWFVRILKPLLRRPPNFTAGGPFNDPGNLLEGTTLLPQVDRLPFSFGAETPGAGVHTFWSRHWTGDPDSRPAGFPLVDILAGVDRELEAAP